MTVANRDTTSAKPLSGIGFQPVIRRIVFSFINRLEARSTLGVVALLTLSVATAADDRPNVILFMADDMGMGDTSAYQDFTGNGDDVQLHTPAMERLARMGVRFTDAHTPSSRCSPTRYGLLTGRAPWRTRLKHWVLFGAQSDPLIEKDRPTLATLFRDQGYSTGMVGKWHLGLLYRQPDGGISDSLEDADLTKPLADGPIDHGFEFSRFNSRSHGSSAPNPTTRKKGGPGFIHGRDLVSVRDNSSFYEEGPKAYILDELGSRYSNHAIEFLTSHLKGNANEGRPFFLYYPANSNHTKHTPDKAIAGVPIKGHSKTKSGASGTNRMDFVYENDVALGRLIDWLAANDDPRHAGKRLIETTIVIFTSDNGAEKNDKAFTGPFRSNKASCYEGGHRVPFLVSWPAGGVGDGGEETPGQSNATPISLTDMYATFSEVLGVSLPDLASGAKGAEDSVSALAYWKGAVSDRSYVPMFCNDNANGFKQTKQAGKQPTSNDPATLMMRLDNPVVDGTTFAGQWKALYDASLIRDGRAELLELYDLSSDRMESIDHVAEPRLKPLRVHLNQMALKHRMAGGHRLVALGKGEPIHIDLRKEARPVIQRGGLNVRLGASGDDELAFEAQGLGVMGGGSNQVDGGEVIAISFDQDVIVEALALAAGDDGVCGGFLRIGDGAAQPIYCVDAHAEKYTKTDHRGMLTDLGVVKTGQTLFLDSGRLYGANALGSWWLQSIQVRLLDSPSSAGSSKPNILVYLSDDHSQFDSSLYGNDNIPTPEFERLAASGMTFTHAFVASPSCAPSRAAMLTGLMPARNGAEANHTYPRPGTHSLIADLQDAGYQVAAFGKVAHGGPKQVASYGFDHIGKERTIQKVRGEVEAWLTQRKSKKPLCLFVGTQNPHVPWTSPPTFDPAEVAFPPHHLDTPATREHRAAYYQEIKELDAFLGELRAIAANSLGENTLFIHTSDHGSQWPFGKWNLYDYGIRVPFIAAWGGKIAPDTRSDAMISWVDLLPTLIDITGGTTPGNLDGQSFANVLLGKASQHRDVIFTTHTGDTVKNIFPIRSIRTREWKLVHNLHPEFAFTNHSDLDRKPQAGAYWNEWTELAKVDERAKRIVDQYYQRPEWQLFHVSQDRWEQTNLIDEPEHAARVTELKRRLRSWMAEQGDQQLVQSEPRRLQDRPSWHPDY
ncbi:MAG: sulfatase-like hydrolase/transferase, partial [Planctomycetota bacterium]